MVKKRKNYIMKVIEERCILLTALLLIADDFTGALDTGVQFATSGASTRVITGQNPRLSQYLDTCQVLVVDAETRHVSARRAYDIVYEIAVQAAALQIPHIYKKTDSALRGNVGAELAALLDATGEKTLPFLPAFPQMDRNTVSGVHYIAGVPVAESVFGIDPFEPVLSSCVAELIGTQTSIPARSFPAVTGENIPSEDGIWIFDAASLENLRTTGHALAVHNKLRIMAGCAGFGAVLPELLHLGSHTVKPIFDLDPRFTVVCGSVNPITVAQVAYAKAHGFCRVRLTPKQKLNLDYWKTSEGEDTLRKINELLEIHSLRILDTNDDESNRETADYAARHGMTIQDIRVAVSGTIGYLVSRLFANPQMGTILITGGDTLLQCMDYMEVHEIEPLRELDAGVVLSRFTYHGVSRYVISKSGGFGKENLLTELANVINPNQNRMEDAI